MSDQQQWQDQQQEPLPEQQPPQEQDDPMAVRERLAAQVKDDYAKAEQPGLHPGNRPSQRLDLAEGMRDPHKTTPDLEDVTGNPGHLNINPYASAVNRPVPKDGDVESINEPPPQPQDQGGYPQQADTPYPYEPPRDQQRPRDQPYPPY